METISLLSLARECREYPRVREIHQFPDSVVVTHTAGEEQMHLIDRGERIEIKYFDSNALFYETETCRRDQVSRRIRQWADH